MGGSKPLSYSTPNARRAAKNAAEVAALRRAGVSVHTSPSFPNGAYFAVEGTGHWAHEIETARILAENGISTVLKQEGVIVPKLRAALPSFDGTGHGMTFEIRQTAPHVSKHFAAKVADAISHSMKRSNISNYSIQADVAVSFTQNPRVRESHVREGISIHAKRKNKAAPRFLLQVDGIGRKVYVYKVK